MNLPKHVLYKQEDISLDQIDELASKIADELTQNDFFCLWLQGDIGAGKTTLTGKILHHLGLNSESPVRSPTFTYLTVYKINNKDYAHLDFYRLESGNKGIADLLSYIDYDGLFIEWPEKLGLDAAIIQPTHLLSIEKGKDSGSRSYSLFKIS